MQIDLSQAWRTVQHMINAFIAALPRLLLALVVFAIFVGIAFAAKSIVRRTAARRGGHQTLELALGRLAQSAIIVLGALIAFSTAFPTFSPANLVSLLGVGSVAIGFAFKDIFQNFLAGLLILVTKPFRVGDEIAFREHEGTVEDIQTRATLVRTSDGRRVVIPNSDLYTNTVVVNTAFKTRRMHYDFGIGYADDVDRARQIITEVLTGAEGILPDPKADCVVVALAESSVTLRARWWTDSRAGGDAALGRVLGEVKTRLQAAGIDLPYPTRQILLHDQTEETDGDRRRQREGWPTGDAEVPRPRAAVEGARHDEGARSAHGEGNGSPRRPQSADGGARRD
ncbi:MAG TPA: mechanosensitive ion channel family protein [Gemmatimonadaceae bacterium]|nr:mechanosensitive ion channel family protein [Gemmatimonadaceae bacterium]